ncbi:MAG: ADP-ribosylation factor-like protein [Candidatus Hodarchaeota archaeon]
MFFYFSYFSLDLSFLLKEFFYKLKGNKSEIIGKNWKMKVLLMGMANSGKTTIAKNVFEGKSLDELENIPSTEFIETKDYVYRHIFHINTFDCGGDQQFLKAYRSEDFKNRIFTKVDLLLWIIDSSDINSVESSLIEFMKSYILLEEFSPEAQIHILAHKYDNKKIELKEIKKRINDYGLKKLMTKIKYHSTSIKNNSAQQTFKSILDGFLQSDVTWIIATGYIILKELGQQYKLIKENEIKYKPKFEIEKFQNVFTCSSEDWTKRFLEEKEKLKELQDYFWENNNLSLIKAQFDIVNPRQVHCTMKFKPTRSRSSIFIDFLIRLPLKYPLIPPKASDFSNYDFIRDHHDYRRWDDDDPTFKDFQFACLGKLEERWEKDGSMGLAHYIQMLFYYAAFDHFAIRL